MESKSQSVCELEQRIEQLEEELALYRGQSVFPDNKFGQLEDLEDFFTTALDLFCIANTDGHFIRVNKEWENILGYSTTELENSSFLDFVHPDDIPATLEAVASLNNQQVVLNFTNRYRCKDGSYHYIEWRSLPRGKLIYAAARDITERLSSQERLQSIFRVAPMGIGMVKDRVFTELNPRITEMTGYTREELLGQSARMLYATEEDYNFVGAEKYQQIGHTGTGVVQTRWQRKDGSIIDIILASTPINVDNLSEGVTFTALDITSRKSTEEALQLKNQEYESLNEELTQINEQLFIAKEKAEESDRLKTAFLQNMSHEIRTPMNAIVGFSDFLRDETISEEKRQSFIEIIIDSSRQLLEIINDILTISFIETRLERVTLQPVAINQLIGELVSIFQPKAHDKDLELKTFLPFIEPCDCLLTDRTKLMQILTNLLSNALKFTPRGYIETGYRLVKTGNKKTLEIYVKDTGIGIPSEKQQLIFERFVQGDNSIRKKYGGTGLGLSICQGFARLLNGDIRVISQPDIGSEFILTLPYQPATAWEEIENFCDIANHSATLLVAEDDEFNMLYLREYFSRTEFLVIYANDGQEAVDLFSLHPEIDLVLMDIKMPGVDGYEAARQIKSLRPAIPVIAQSAYALSQEIERYSDIFDGYVTKPIDRIKLSNAIAKYIRA